MILPTRSSSPLQISQVVRDREVVRYNMELGRLREQTKAQTVFELAREMKDAGVKPNLVTYEHLMDACGDIAAYGEAWAVYEDMLAVGIEPNRHFFHKMLYVSHCSSACNAASRFSVAYITPPRRNDIDP